MTHVILKLVTGAVVFGGCENITEGNIVVTKPYTYIVNDEGIPGIAPYDAYAFQGELNKMTFPITAVLQFSDFADCKEARDAYISVTSGIVIPNNKIIL